MAFPKLAPVNGSALENALKAGVRKSDGTAYAAFDQIQEWIVSERAIRDAAAATHEGVFGDGGVKNDLDSLRGMADHRLDILEAKVSALEAAPPSPFPG